MLQFFFAIGTWYLNSGLALIPTKMTAVCLDITPRCQSLGCLALLMCFKLLMCTYILYLIISNLLRYSLQINVVISAYIFMWFCLNSAASSERHHPYCYIWLGQLLVPHLLPLDSLHVLHIHQCITLYTGVLIILTNCTSVSFVFNRMQKTVGSEWLLYKGWCPLLCWWL